jgi:hypothetical protein
LQSFAKEEARRDRRKILARKNPWEKIEKGGKCEQWNNHELWPCDRFDSTKPHADDDEAHASNE